MRVVPKSDIYVESTVQSNVESTDHFLLFTLRTTYA